MMAIGSTSCVVSHVSTNHAIQNIRRVVPISILSRNGKYDKIRTSFLRSSFRTLSSTQENATPEISTEKTEERTVSPDSEGNGAATNHASSSDELQLPEFGPWKQFLIKLRMLTALPWQRVKKGSVFVLKISGSVDEQLGTRFSTSVNLPQIVENLRKAASDPRISGLVLQVDPLSCGWGKVEEIKRHILLFKKSGKFTISYISVGGEKEYYLATTCDEIYTPPGAYLSLKGLSVQGQYLGGVLEKVGIEPQVERIGKYKSAGDQLSKKGMSPENREMLTAILEDVYANWTQGVASARGKTVEELEELLNEGVVRVQDLKDRGWITDIKYNSEIEEDLKKRLKIDEDDDLETVDNKKYSRVKPWTIGVGGTGDRIAVIRAVGAISRGKRGSSSMSGVTSDDIIRLIRRVKEEDRFKALVLRIDSPGGDALASDLMWHEIRELAKKKPVVASMADVAASGGYYMAMAADVIVAEELTLTGSIGVVLAKFNLKELYNRIGLAKETISRGKFAEVDSDQRSFTPEEEAFFKKGAQNAYESFRNKAAQSRGLEPEKMEEYAQGRVWTGKAARERNLVDVTGGISKAIQIAKEKAGIAPEKQVRLVELSRQMPSIQQLLFSGSNLFALTFGNSEVRSLTLREILLDCLIDEFDALTSEGPKYLMEDIFMDGFLGAHSSSIRGILSRLPQK